MTLKSIPEMYWETIVKSLYAGTCVPFLGAGVNLSCFKGEEGLPLGGEVALRLVESMIRPPSGAKPPDWSAVKSQNIKQYRQRIYNALQDLTTLGPAAELKFIEARLKEMLDTIIPTNENVAALQNLENLIGALAGLESLIPPTDLNGVRSCFILDSILPDDEKETKLAHVIFDASLEPYRDLMRVALQDLARVSLRYRSYKDLYEFVDKLKELIPDTERKPTRLLQTLADIPLQLVVTTNYDRLMERALELFNPRNIREPVELTALIMNDSSLVSQCLYSLLSREMKDLLESYDDEKQPAPYIPPSQWAAELNRIIQERSIHLLEETGVAENGPAPAILKRPRTTEEVRLNRLLIERSYPGAVEPLNKPYQTVVQPIESFQGSEEVKNRKSLSVNDGLILYKLHGTFTDAKPVKETRPVITEEDYIEFLTNVGGKGEGIDNQIKEKIKDSTMLFLGYSLEDWNFRALFKGLVEKVNPVERRYSFAIQKEPSDFWVKFWEDKHVIIFDVDLCAFTLELEQRYNEYRDKKEAEFRQKDVEESEALKQLGKNRRKRRDDEEEGL